MTSAHDDGLTGARSRRSGDTSAPADEGNAIVEFLYLALVLMVPLVYVMLGVFDAQRASFGVTEAARQAGRTWVATPGCDRTRAVRAAQLALGDQGVTATAIDVPTTCPAPGGRAEVRVRSFVQLRGVGAILPRERGGFSVTGRFVAVRDRFAP